MKSPHYESTTRVRRVDVGHLTVELLEQRCLLAADLLQVGAVYVEQDGGSDDSPDTIEITFLGGAVGTQLTSLTIDGDRDGNGYGSGDVFFDTADTSPGADLSFPLEIVALETVAAGATVAASFQDGATALVLEFDKFHAGDRLLLRVDVDEVEWLDPNATDAENDEGIDPITSGVEFHGSIFKASFSAPHYVSADVETRFVNTYDVALMKTGLPLPADDHEGKRDRTAGAFATLRQQLIPASVSGFVYHDRNDNGVKDGGEEGIANSVIRILPINSIEAQEVVTVQTDGSGFYQSGEISPGTYQIVQAEQPAGYFDGKDSVGSVDGVVRGVLAADNDQIDEVLLNGGDRGVNFNFGELLPVALHGQVHVAGRDGDCHDETERSPLAGAELRLINADGDVVQVTVSDRQGQYQFTDLHPGTYSVEESTPVGLFDGDAVAGTVNGRIAGTVVDAGRIEQIILASGQDARDYNFCELRPSSISGFVYHDEDGDGGRGTNEAAIGGVVVTLLNSDGEVVATTATDAAGMYEFTDLRAGRYEVVESQPEGWLDGAESAGLLLGLPVGAVVNNDRIEQIDIQWGDAATELNFGEQLPGSISGRVHADQDGDCILDAGEELLAGVTIQLLDDAGQLIAETETDADGRYAFDGIRPGIYQIVQQQPSGYFDGSARPGSGGGLESVNRITQVVVGSGQNLTEYDFCELPAGTLSGRVFQDGPTLVLSSGEAKPALQSVRDGLFTPDDTPLEGVVVELRDGISGQPILADVVLPGYYPDGPLWAITDADGHYEFNGLPRGNYAVFEIQPDGYEDGLDTPGTTSGIAVNQGDSISPFILSLLTVNPGNDAILRIPLAAGAISEQNNFSEIRTETSPPPFVPPFVQPPSPPLQIEAPSAPRFFSVPWQHSPQQPAPITTPVYLRVGGGSAFSWHLSVIDGGDPRDSNAAPEAVWKTASMLTSSNWMESAGKDLLWRLFATVPESADEPETATEYFFGVRGSIPVAGDFNGDGITEMGFFIDGQWFLDANRNGAWDEGDVWAQLGASGDRPVIGDWNGDGKDDIGIYGPAWSGDWRALPEEPGLPDRANRVESRPKNVPPVADEATSGFRSLKRTASGRPRIDVIDHVFLFGQESDVPVTGDWNGDGISSIGVFRSGRWVLDTDGDGRLTQNDASHEFGIAGDLPVVGDFNADGIDDLAVFRDGQWTVDSNGNRMVDATDRVFELGGPGNRPIAGDWDGDGADDPGVTNQ